MYVVTFYILIWHGRIQISIFWRISRKFTIDPTIFCKDKHRCESDRLNFINKFWHQNNNQKFRNLKNVVILMRGDANVVIIKFCGAMNEVYILLPNFVNRIGWRNILKSTGWLFGMMYWMDFSYVHIFLINIWTNCCTIIRKNSKS